MDAWPRETSANALLAHELTHELTHHADPADPRRHPSQRQIRLGVSPDTMARGHHGKEVPPVHSRKPLGRWDEESDDDCL